MASRSGVAVASAIHRYRVICDRSCAKRSKRRSKIGGAGERSELRGDDGVEERRVEVTGEAIADVDAPTAELDEEAVVSRGLVGGFRKGAHQLARSAFEHIRRGARPIRPEPAARLVAFAAENDRDVGRGGLRAEQPAELDPGDAGHPEIGDDRSRRRRKRHVRTRGGVARLFDDVALRAQTPPEDLATRVARIDEQNAFPRIHNQSTYDSWTPKTLIRHGPQRRVMRCEQIGTSR